MDKSPYRLSVPDSNGIFTYVGDEVTWKGKNGTDTGTVICISQELVRSGPLYSFVSRYKDGKNPMRLKETIKVKNRKGQIINIKHFVLL